MRQAKSGSISVSAAKRQTQKITKIEKRSDRTKCRNLLEAQLTKRFIPHVDCFEKRKKIATNTIEKITIHRTKKGVGQGYGEPKIATESSLF